MASLQADLSGNRSLIATFFVAFNVIFATDEPDYPVSNRTLVSEEYRIVLTSPSTEKPSTKMATSRLNRT